MKITLRNLAKRFGTTTVVNGVSLEIASGEMFFLLGPSGCGKTTILRMLAGFYDPDQGDILFGERRINAVPPQDRNAALVFQNYAIWPHMTVFENVAYGLRVRKIGEDELQRRAHEALAQVRMGHLAERKPTQLSGGQQQRVALARAMVVRPDLMLYDEPLSNLDAKLRLEMRDEIQKLHHASPTTSVYVTHDQEEALSLASRIAVMHGGKVLQVGTPKEIYDRPADPFVASFIGEVNLYEVPSPLASKLGLKANGAKQFGFRPERVALGGDGVPAIVEQFVYLGNRNALELKAETGELVKAWTPDYLERGQQVRFSVPDKFLLTFES
jgi:ABC-type sugar transport system ATPase subunit